MAIPFKRSRAARLIMMVPAASLVLTGCAEKTVEAQVYNSVNECVAFYNPIEQCEAAFKDAKNIHPSVAPRYSNVYECEADFGVGQCQGNAEVAEEMAQSNALASDQVAANSPTNPERQQSSSFFMPMMMGFLAGQMMNRGNAQAAPNQPLYKSRDDKNTFRTANNAAVATKPGPTQVRPSATQLKPASFVRRGGFGAQAMARSTNNTYGG